MTPVLQIQLHVTGMATPTKAHTRDVGIDLTCMDVIEQGQGVFLMDTGVSIAPPLGYYTELFSRSSIIKTEFIQANGVGIIDPDYRGVIYLPLRYLGAGDGLSTAKKMIGRRIAQLVLKRLEPVQVKVCTSLDETKRGTHGFGSTGL